MLPSVLCLCCTALGTLCPSAGKSIWKCYRRWSVGTLSTYALTCLVSRYLRSIKTLDRHGREKGERGRREITPSV